MNKPSQSTAIEVQYENDLREFENTPTPPVTVRQKGADRGTGLTIKKKVRGGYFLKIETVVLLIVRYNNKSEDSPENTLNIDVVLIYFTGLV